jgi:hypothetical protein
MFQIENFSLFTMVTLMSHFIGHVIQDFFRYVNRFDMEEWMIFASAVIVFGLLCLKGWMRKI